MDCFVASLLAMTGGAGGQVRRPQWRWQQTHIALTYLMCYEAGMVLDQTSSAGLRVAPIVIDDRSRLPGRFFGRFATSATSELTRAA